MIIPYNNKKPSIDDTVFVAPGAHLIGDISIGKDSTIWFNAVLRGDEDSITIGEKCSIQDNSTIHLFEGCPVVIEDEVTVGHNVILHGCKIGKRSIIGMGSTILDNVEIGEECIVGANTLISSGKIIPPRSLVIGSPGKVVRRLNDKDLELIQLSIDTYVQKGKDFKGILD
ncbi:gamma carbonic anhydrase family protein [Peribacillus frigoritolerans]|jgi:carbonic anhydrase/acetyltransferase-like protein (isoleucine patch superfamily)|uniref:gamma carbonic anhydrase family protein n=1 Tax=Peribacillus frigoritolerans TaxID=450367 RepID=UPI0021CF98B2|nr:gamma carbonic anhydrase family protein [Peribacillus frigoritolerans]MCU6601042.1 gamma carbonic anhydrase family protein [Peribacillus frigoritolerans]MDF1998939.1 gamma carbonic anhydrase family protein [Peribacillus frigoritolerans]MED3786499.1 gamma carbonic anhydrase family protein [Peribacillus frigoritolerans]MED4694391.1 gamma carbonic anhydrase family protein [Peribacillus frigoritolerans]UYY99967.1 gamma carbonic anhydrase family protein [Peribacillus frigoritolerans]